MVFVFLNTLNLISIDLFELTEDLLEFDEF